MKNKASKVSLYVGIFSILGLGIWYYGFNGMATLGTILPDGAGSNLIAAMLIITGLFLVYKVGVRVIGSTVRKSKGAPGEGVMLGSVFKFMLIIVAGVVVFSVWMTFDAMGTLFVTFGGMFLGWSLQSPISGMAAWLLISIARPFRIGDRVQLPSQGLVGDVVSISPLYTTLNQVGGSVGSEEPVNRTILIPNSMLFSAIVINYTPKNQDALIKRSRDRQDCSQANSRSAYMLDEFVLRISFDSNWDEAEQILLRAARNVTGDIIRETGQEPYIRADMGDWYGIFMRLRFMTNATERPRIIYEISKRVFREVQQNEKVDLAIPYIYSFRKGAKWMPSGLALERLEQGPVLSMETEPEEMPKFGQEMGTFPVQQKNRK